MEQPSLHDSLCLLLSGMNLLDLLQVLDLICPPLLLHILLHVHPYGDSFLSVLLSATILYWLVFLVFSPSSTLPSFICLFLLIRVLSTTPQTASLLSLFFTTTTYQQWWLSLKLACFLCLFLDIPLYFKEPSTLLRS
jgi:hypothetical protein